MRRKAQNKITYHMLLNTAKMAIAGILVVCLTLLSGCKKADISADSAGLSEELNGTNQEEAGTSEDANTALGDIKNGAENDAENVFEMPDRPVESTIFIDPVANISDEFIRGMDCSAVLACENSGVKYYDFDGNEQDVFKTLAQAGVNYIRLRVWNDPYDKNGNGYGGGNNDIPTAIELGKRASKYGMKVCIDFHYSDFWADPKRQHAPKAWEGMSIEEKSTALYDFTKESLTKLLDEGVDVGMVQIGNEINNGMSGETSIPAVMELLCSGSKAVREISDAYGKEIQIAVHYTNIEDIKGIESTAMKLLAHGVDYDVFGISYYPFWHGPFENMQNVAKSIMEKFDKKVVIAETSYCYTSEDGDGTGNSFSGIGGLVDGYAATVQSQASMIRDICEKANEVGALGVFYWEGTWLPVGRSTDNNSPIWEKYGSGWASSFSADYDPEDAGLYYGGCAWENQAMFDFEGHPLESLNVFKYLKYGSTAPLIVDSIPEVYITCAVGSELKLPEKTLVIYNDRSKNTDVPIKWDETQISSIDTGIGGSYDIKGTLDDGSETTAHLEIKMLNYILNPSFEEDDKSMWTVNYEGSDNPTDFQVKADDAHDGDVSFHFWSGKSDMEFSIEQEISDLEPATYSFSIFAQGGDVDPNFDAEMYIYAKTDDTELKQDFMVTKWAEWQNPEIPEINVTEGDKVTIGVHIKSNVKSWGSVDEFTLNRLND